MSEAPGRSCPVPYRYGAPALAACAAFEVETLWVAGGLYGNRFALARLLELFDAESGSKALVFNGDFHWFDCDGADFAAIDEAVGRHRATRGNVETELAGADAGAGCGCAYPEWVGEAEVARSNRILERLRGVACGFPETRRALGALPMFRAAAVAGERIAIVHGDADSLAGWGFSQERLAAPGGIAAARDALRRAQARVIASSHTCLPVLQSCGEAGVIVNNGAAGMPNFRATQFGVATRVSVRPRAGALYAVRAGRLYVEAQPIRYDHPRWLERFVELWPPGSDAFESYHRRIVHGPAYDLPLAQRAA
ncbi:MAG: hypothetical protein A3F77_05145 [Betaproteobacteria bacterium RIFCSPLOWO2_12_FULL_67_28]|nr:MAG: hypothetical protein A3I65_00510 [Betaproteobacteria bacterium RIFCSPLOWO2_02_FULL_68_150]OGA63679.1 MAG: hypothetical protein A3F77_05145 [Betaproteobacteria bacterium RIFCSPLOWO2_12_FULL_67_28]